MDSEKQESPYDPTHHEWRHIRDMIMSGDSLTNISEYISGLTGSRTRTIKWLEPQNADIRGSLDLMHMAILLNRPDVVQYFFEKELSVKSDERAKRVYIPYLHFACICGFEDIIDLVVAYRSLEKTHYITTATMYWVNFSTLFEEGN